MQGNTRLSFRLLAYPAVCFALALTLVLSGCGEEEPVDCCNPEVAEAHAELCNPDYQACGETCEDLGTCGMEYECATVNVKVTNSFTDNKPRTVYVKTDSYVSLTDWYYHRPPSSHYQLLDGVTMYPAVATLTGGASYTFASVMCVYPDGVFVVDGEEIGVTAGDGTVLQPPLGQHHTAVAITSSNLGTYDCTVDMGRYSDDAGNMRDAIVTKCSHR